MGGLQWWHLILLLIVAGAIYATVSAIKSSQEEAQEAGTLRSLPASVIHVVGQMDPTSQAAFFREYESKKKKKSIGWILWFFLGFHYLYARKIGLQFAYWFTFGGFGIWAIADLFRMPSIIRSSNEQIAREALQTLQIGASFRQNPSPVQQFAPQSVARSFEPAPNSVNPGRWAPDPIGSHELRYWDGFQWTEHVANSGVQSVSPLS